MRRLLLLPLVLSVGSMTALFASCADGTSESGTDVPLDTGSGPIDSGVDSGVDTKVEPADTAEADSGTADTATKTDAPADAADAPIPWPTCDSRPDGTTARTIAEIWAANPTMPSYTWVSGVTVTAVSQGGCVADKACQIFVQEGSATTLAGAAKHAIKIFVSAKAASHFLGIAPGDVVDTAGHAVRYTLDGQNELLLEVNDLLRGCIKKTGTGTIAAVPATLVELGDYAAYETNIGPVLVRVSDVSGKPDMTMTTIFGIYPTTGGPEAGGAQPMSLSPYFLPGGAFTGLTGGTKTDFASITGVYGLFMPTSASDAGLSKYLVLYPRTMVDVVKK